MKFSRVRSKSIQYYYMKDSFLFSRGSALETDGSIKIMPSIENLPIDNLKGIHDRISRMNGDLECVKIILKSHILGVLLIDGVTGLVVSENGKLLIPHECKVHQHSILGMINDGIARIHDGENKNEVLLNVQTWMIENGLDELAQL